MSRSRHLTRLCLLPVLALCACNGGPAPAAGDTGSDANADAELAARFPFRDIAIAPTALDGCRAPIEEGCLTCCKDDASFGSSCASEPVPSYCSPDVEPWYNIIGGASTCPGAEEPACAMCSRRDERLLRALERPEGCDCSTQVIGIDPCHSRGCACYCDTASRLLASCPQAP